MACKTNITQRLSHRNDVSSRVPIDPIDARPLVIDSPPEFTRSIEQSDPGSSRSDRDKWAISKFRRIFKGQLRNVRDDPGDMTSIDVFVLLQLIAAILQHIAVIHSVGIKKMYKIYHTIASASLIAWV